MSTQKHRLEIRQSDLTQIWQMAIHRWAQNAGPLEAVFARASDEYMRARIKLAEGVVVEELDR